MTIKDKITAMEQILENIIIHYSDINTSATEYAEQVELILRLQDSITQLKKESRRHDLLLSSN